MPSDQTGDLVANLGALLEEEQRALIAGDLDRIALLVDRKAALVDALNGLKDGSVPKIKAVQRQLERNQSLLQSAMRGVRRVAARLSALHTAQSTVTVYDGRGQMQKYASVIKPKFEQRS